MIINLSDRLDPQEVLFSLTRNDFGEDYKTFMSTDGRLITFKTTSDRYSVFRRSLCCANPECNREITYAILQTFPVDNPRNIGHWNFFSKDNILMTKDHIVPKSKGGRNHVSNYQTMCFECNSKKKANICATSALKN